MTSAVQSAPAYRIDRWDLNGNAVQHVADLDDLTVALATYEAACNLWPENCLTLREGVPRNRGQPTHATQQ
jgi:hypothetical protein